MSLHRREFLVGSLAAAAYAGVAAGQSGGKIRIGQIGTGHAHAAGKMETMRSLPELFEVVGVVEPDEKRRAAAMKNKAYADLPFIDEQQLFQTPGLRAVAVETEVKDLVPTAMRCVSRGLHVHHDKPGGESLEEFAAMLAAATQNKAIVQMGYMLRYNAGMQVCYTAVREGWLGNVFSVHAEMSKRSDGERTKLSAYRGGMMFELGCHLLDSIVFMFGKPRKVTSIARASGLKDDTLKDNMTAVLEWEQCVATVKSSLIDFAGGPRRQLVLSGTEGTTELRPLEPPTLQVTLMNPRASYKRGSQTATFEKKGRYDLEFIDLAAVIRGEKPFAWSPQHDLAAHETILRASGMM